MMLLKILGLFFLGHTVNWMQVCAPKLPVLKDHFWLTLVSLSILCGLLFVKGFTLGLDDYGSFQLRIVSFVAGTVVYPVLGSLFLNEPLMTLKNFISIVLCSFIIAVQIKL